MTEPCRLCGNRELFPVIDLGDMPVAHRMLDDAQTPEDVFAFHVVHCPACGLSQIEYPIAPETLYAGFNFNFSSWKNEPHLAQEADWVFADRTFASAIDIGCNDGRFLAAVQDRGVETCVGIEPNHVPASKAAERGFPIVQQMLDSSVAEEVITTYDKFDLVTSRQVLEHTLDPIAFLKAARKLLKDDGLLFLDMPDFEPTLHHADVSTLWEEHPSYFTEPTLRRLLGEAGFECTGVRRYDFSGGCLAVTAIPASEPSPGNTDVPAVNDLASTFGARARAYGDDLMRYLQARRDSGATVVLYGVGVRGCTAVNGYGLGPAIDFAVDDQKERQGLFLPGARLEIKPVEELAAANDTVVVLLAVNNENEDKVTDRLRNLLGDRVTTISMCCPRDFGQDLRNLAAMDAVDR
ncbi:MAG: class I SAM-dependent methyltransferase [Rhodospirillales bacterium]